ncbi:MAG: universal stress protein [Bacillota bacterium]
MFKKILVALHGSESLKSVEKMVWLISRQHVPVTLIHVLETGLSHYGYMDTLASSVTKDQFVKYINELAEEQKNSAFELFDRAAGSDELNTNYMTAGGKTGPEIVKEAESGQYDLVMIGRKQGVKIGNTSTKTREYLIARLPCSLFIFN